MKITVELGSRKWGLAVATPRPAEYHVCFEVAEISRVVEHELVLPNHEALKKLSESIERDGFLHPILVSELNTRFVIADGTHRATVLSMVKRHRNYPALNALLVNLTRSGFTRDAWAMVFKRGDPRLISLTQDPSFVEDPGITERSALKRFEQGDVAAILKRGEQVGVITTLPQPRLDFLRYVKSLDTLVGCPDRYETIAQSFHGEDDFLILAPPNDQLGDMSLLVDRPELRRSKGSRTVIPVRPMYLPIPLSTLSLSKAECEKEIQSLIDDLINQHRVVFIQPGARNLNYCHEIYDHYLLAFRQDLLNKDKPLRDSYASIPWQPVISENSASSR